MEYSHLFDPETYRDDEPVGIVAAPPGVVSVAIPEAYWCYVPERLFARIIFLGQAYSLHFPNLISSQRDTELDATQCESFLTEIALLRGLVADDALGEQLEAMELVIARVIRNQERTLLISPP